MALSESILEILRQDSDPSVLIAYLLDGLRSGSIPPLESPTERQAYEEGAKLVRGLVERTIKARLEPRLAEPLDVPEDIFEQAVLRDLPADLLDQYFTVDMLTRVSGVAGRWLKLRELTVTLVPSEQVLRRLAEAGRCYLYGMYNGTAVLCRAALELALDEQAGLLGGVSRVPEKLADKIDWAYGRRILPDAGRAHRVRNLGNDGVHPRNDGVHYGSVTQTQAHSAHWRDPHAPLRRRRSRVNEQSSRGRNRDTGPLWLPRP